MAAFDGLLREALVVAGVLCVPILVLATAVGTFVAVLAATAQVQEQTLSLLPKLLAVGFAIAAFGMFGMQLCAGLFADALRQIPQIVQSL